MWKIYNKDDNDEGDNVDNDNRLQTFNKKSSHGPWAQVS